MKRPTRRAGAFLIALAGLGACSAKKVPDTPFGLEPQVARTDAQALAAYAAAVEPGSFGRIDAIPGRPLMLVLGSQAPRTEDRAPPNYFAKTPDPLAIRSARLSDGRALGARTYAVTTTSPLPPDANPDSAFIRWMNISNAPPIGAWASSSIDQSSLTQPSLRIAAIEIPRDAAGPSLWIDEKPANVQWLVDPDTILPPTQVNWPPMLPAAASNDTQLIRTLRAVAQSPLERWRVRLLIDGLALAKPDPSRGVSPYADPIVEAMAMQVEHRWRLALARLAQVEAPLAAQVKARLCAVMKLPGEDKAHVWVPAWPTDQDALERLLTDLLDPSMRRGDLPARAYQWLREQQQGAIWVWDDGGTLSTVKTKPDAASLKSGIAEDNKTLTLADQVDAAPLTKRAELRPSPIVFIGVSNMTDRPETVWAAYAPPSDAATTQLEVTPVAPSESVVIPVQTLTLNPAQVRELTSAAVKLGRLTADVPVRTTLFQATPPGFNCFGFAPDLSLESWQYGLLSRVPTGWETTARIVRVAPGAGPDIDAQEDGTAGWEAIVTCRFVPDQHKLTSRPEDEYVDIFLGPSAGVTIAYRVARSGSVQQMNLPEAADGPQRQLKVTLAPQSWSFRLPLSASAIQEGVLQLTIMRHDALRRRSTWPRPRFPWQSSNTAGRAAIDLSTWDELN